MQLFSLFLCVSVFLFLFHALSSLLSAARLPSLRRAAEGDEGAWSGSRIAKVFSTATQISALQQQVIDFSAQPHNFWFSVPFLCVALKSLCFSFSGFARGMYS
jgi:hypothetical protein